MQYYENNNVNIYEYRPYVWGNVATTYYSVKDEIHTTLWRQPSVTQVLNLFEEDIVNNTIKEYPVDRSLKVVSIDFHQILKNVLNSIEL